MKNEYLRHTLATIKYRLKKSLMHGDEQFDNFSLGEGSRSPIEILVHIYDVLNWAVARTDNNNQKLTIPNSSNCRQALSLILNRIDFYDDVLSPKELEAKFVKKLLQGPLADILTHIGQIAMLSRMNNKPIKGENFSEALIQTGVKEE